MTEIKNELSWSFSRQKIFNQCRRAYFYRYYQSWGGWDRSASPEAKKTYLLKNIVSLDQWAGQIVHQVIGMIFNRFQKYGQWFPLEEIQKMALKLFQSGWRESIGKKWKERVRDHLNLFEHYYNIPIPQERIDQIKEKIKICLREFSNSDLSIFFQKSDPSDWLEIPRPAPNFLWEGIKIWANFDFGLKTSGQIRIYDFKTGKKEPDSLQFSCYALYAREKEEFDLSKIFVIPVYLYPTVLDQPIQFSLSQITEIQKYIKQTYREMRDVLDDPDRNLASIKNFPLTENLWTCRRCVFREICEGASREKIIETPFDEDLI